MTKFVVDECTFTQTIRLMKDLGLEVERIQELGMTGVKDPEVFRRAQELKAVLVTNDKGFGDVRTYPPSAHHGVIVLKMEPDPHKVRAVHTVLKELLVREKQFEKSLFVVDTHKYRKRTKP